MKKYTYTFIILCYSFLTYAQIPNPSFENWNTTNITLLTGWQTIGQVSQTTPGTGGNYAIRIERGGPNPYDPGAIIYGEPQGGTFSGGIPFADRPDSLVGNFKYDVTAGDSAWVIFMFKQNGVFLSQDHYYITGSNTSSFIRKAFAVTYSLPGIPDSLIIAFTSTNPDSSFAGSYVILDDVHFTNTAVPLPNGDFENWTTYSNEEPLGWRTSNVNSLLSPALPVTKTSDSYSGNYAIRIENNITPGSEQMGYALAGPQALNGPLPGFPVLAKDTILSGYYKFLPQNNDTLTIGVLMFEQHVQVGGGFFQMSDIISSYTPFSAHIYYNSGYIGTPDSATIFLLAFTGGASPHGNSVLYVDDLQFDPSTSVGISSAKSSPIAISNYPNPCSNYTLVNYTLPESGTVNIKLVDLTGREIAVLYSGDQSAGSHGMRYDSSNLSNGIYHIVIETKNQKQHQKVVVQK